LAGKGKPGANVMLCTDGLANKGLGEMETKEGEETSKAFYMQLGEYAKSKGIVVSVITIKGDGCKLESLGKICELTNGKVTRVNPENILEDFANILKDEVLATKVEVKIRLHEALSFRHEKAEFLKDHGSLFNKLLGNVTGKTEVTFEYQTKTEKELENLGIDIGNILELPFQAQITYTSRHGHSLMRVITKKQKTTQNLDEAEKDLNVKLLAKRQAFVSSDWAQDGDLFKANQVNKKWDNYIMGNMEKNLDTNEKASKELVLYQEKNKKIKKAIHKKAQINLDNKKKVRRGSFNDSDYDSGDEREFHKEVKCTSRNASDDELETDFYKYKKGHSDDEMN